MKLNILSVSAALLVLFAASQLDAHHRHIKAVWVEEGTGVFRTMVIQEQGKPPVEVKKEITRKVKKYFDEYGNEIKFEEIDTDDYPSSSAGDAPALPGNEQPLNLDAFKKIGAGFSYGYYSFSSVYGTALFTSGAFAPWNSNIVFDGYGWQADISFGEFTQFHPGIKVTIGSFTTNKQINSYTSGLNTAAESVSSTVVLVKLDYYHHLTDMFYVSGGVGAFYQDFKTSIVSTLPSYIYAGLEGKTVTAAIDLGAGLKLAVTSNVNLNIGGELYIFLAEKDTGIVGLKLGVAPTAGISATF